MSSLCSYNYGKAIGIFFWEGGIKYGVHQESNAFYFEIDQIYSILDIKFLINSVTLMAEATLFFEVLSSC